MSSLQTTEGATARASPSSVCWWAKFTGGQVSCPSQNVAGSPLTSSDLLLLNLNQLMLSAAAKIPWKSSYFFFRSRAACALRLVLGISNYFLTLPARLTAPDLRQTSATEKQSGSSSLSGFVFVSVLRMVFACFLISSAQGAGGLCC